MSQPPSLQSVQKEGRIVLALQAYKDGHFSSKRAAAIAYDIPESTFRSRVKGVIPRRDLRSPNLKLSATEESTLVDWILSMDQRGLSPRAEYVRQMANLLLQKQSNPSQDNLPTVGQHWVANFVKRHQALQSRYNRKYDYQRAKCEDPTIIREWFRLVQNTIAKYGIHDEDIYNFDKTGFQIGVITTAKVITGSERSSRPVSIQPGNREWVTVIESVASNGWSLPPMVIFEGKVHISTWYTNALPKDWIIGVSENGWTDDTLGLTWLIDVFETHTRACTKGVYRLLILDGHGSHSTPEFDLFCSEHAIITLCMPPHSSHLLQPLDVSCFAVLKRSYRRQIEGFMQVGVNHIDKPDFLTAYLATRKESMAIETICNGFAGTGLVLYNPEQVLSKLNTQLQTPTPPLVLPVNQHPWIPETPHNIAELERQSQAINEFLKRCTTSPPTPAHLALSQLVKGCQLAMHSAIILTEENRHLRSENERQKKKKAKRRLYIATGGVLTVQEGIERSQISDIEHTSGVAIQGASIQPRAPRTCSICKSLVHTARTCPQK